MTEVAAGVPASRTDTTADSSVASSTAASRPVTPSQPLAPSQPMVPSQPLAPSRPMVPSQPSGRADAGYGDPGYNGAGYKGSSYNGSGYDGSGLDDASREGRGYEDAGYTDRAARSDEDEGPVGRAAAASGRFASHMADRLRNNAELAADRGTTTIANEVVEKIAGIAARAVAGVHDLGGDLVRGLAAMRERIGLGDADDDADRGISVRLEGRRASIKVVLVVEFGHPVYEVADEVRANVIGAVEVMLGLEVTAVDVVVDDVHVDEERLAAAKAGLH